LDSYPKTEAFSKLLVDHVARHSWGSSIWPIDAYSQLRDRRTTQGLHIAVRKKQDQNTMQDVSTNAT